MTLWQEPAGQAVTPMPANGQIPAHYNAALAGVNVVVAIANKFRRRLIIANTGTTNMTVGLGFAVDATHGFNVPAGTTWDSGAGICPGDAVNIFGAATAQYDVYEY